MLSKRDSMIYMNATCEIPKLPVYDRNFSDAIWNGLTGDII